MNALLMRPKSLERCCPLGEFIRLWDFCPSGDEGAGGEHQRG